jgi:WD40 repeat protein
LPVILEATAATGAPVTAIASESPRQPLQTIPLETKTHGMAAVVEITREYRQILVGQDAVRALAVSPDGRYIASGTNGSAANVILWDAMTGRQIRRLPADKGHIEALAFSADGRRLMSSNIVLWDVEGGRMISRVNDVAPLQLAVACAHGSSLALRAHRCVGANPGPLGPRPGLVRAAIHRRS